MILKQSITLAISAGVGTILFNILPHHIVILGGLAISLMLILTRILRVHLIPSFAISLLPIVLHVTYLWVFPLSVLISSYGMLIAVWIVNRVKVNGFVPEIFR